MKTRIYFLQIKFLKEIVMLALFAINVIAQIKEPPELIPYRKGDRWGYCDRTKKIVIECKYDEADRFVGEYAEVKLNNVKFYIDKKGNKVELKQLDEQDSQEDIGGVGLETFEENGFWGLKDNTGRIVVKPKYQEITDFSEGLAVVKRDNKYGYIDNTGKEVIPVKYEKAFLFSDGLALVITDGNKGFIDARGTEYWEDVCGKLDTNWLKSNVVLRYEIDYFTKFDVELKEVSDQKILYGWYRNNKRGFDIEITKNALENAYKHLNYIYKFDSKDLILSDATSVFCSRKMFSEMVKNKKVTYYPYYRVEDTELKPVTFKFKERKIRCVKKGNTFVGLECLVFEADTGEKLVVLNNKKYPLIVSMNLDFVIHLKEIKDK